MTAKWFQPAVGAVLTVLCGLLLWRTPLGVWGTPLAEAWENASYDSLFSFSSRAITNPVVLVLMDTEARERLGLDPAQPWPREQHAKLLNKLAEDKSSLVVFDVLFKAEQNSETNKLLADAMREHGQVILMADVEGKEDPQMPGFTPQLPQKIFLDAAAGCGLGHADPNTLGTARRHYPFSGPGEGELHSLGWAAASVYLAKNNSAAKLDSASEHQWLRYYGENGPGERMSYDQALAKTNGFFRDKIIFIGGWPGKPDDPGFVEKNNDKFSTPYTHWNNKAVGGVAIMATTFLNLINGDWLRRPAPALEFLLLVATGILLGGGLCRLRPMTAGVVAGVSALAVMLGFVTWSYYTNFWFPWLVIAGGQVPCALAWAMFAPKPQSEWTEKFPGYTVLGEPFGEGAYGKVWLVRNALGQLQALKEIERAKFDDAAPYDREFNGIKNYKPISHRHLGLLHIDHVNRNDRKGYFYYVMELGDALNPGWEKRGEPYQPQVLTSVCKQAEDGRLPVRECVRIGIALLEALDYLHQQGLVHRDIKPSNIIFVNGRPKLADVGLVRKTGGEVTYVGTEFYMPPEGPGTPLADIYALGMVLYVISTGKSPRSFSELSTTLVSKPEFMRLNEIICRACQPVAAQRYDSTGPMLAALRQVQSEFLPDTPQRI